MANTLTLLRKRSMSDNISSRNFYSYDKANGGKRHHWYVHKAIDFDTDIFEAITVIRNTSHKDEVHIHLNGFGGSVDVGWQIIQAMREADGVIYTYNEGVCASMFAMIFLSGNYCCPSKHSTLMLHQVQTCTGYGANSDNIRVLSFIQDRALAMFKDIVRGFVTEEEMERMFTSNFDMYLSYEEQIERFKSMNKEFEDTDEEDEMDVIGPHEAQEIFMWPLAYVSTQINNYVMQYTTSKGNMAGNHVITVDKLPTDYHDQVKSALYHAGYEDVGIISLGNDKVAITFRVSEQSEEEESE